MDRTMGQPPEDDGFGDFRAKVKGLPREQRMAALKEMEDAVLENLRSNMLADLYAEDQPAPPGAPPVTPVGGPGHGQPVMEEDETTLGPLQDRARKMLQERGLANDNAAVDSFMEILKQGKSPAESLEMFKRTPKTAPAPMGAIIDDEEEPIALRGMDARMGAADPSAVDTNSPGYKQFLREHEAELRAGGMTPENDPDRWSKAMQDAPMWYSGDTANPTKYQQPMGPGAMGARDGAQVEGGVDEEDPDLPYGATPLPVGSMKGKPYPDQKDFGGGPTDSWVSEAYRWEKDNGAFDLEYDSPEYKQFVADYMAKLNGGGGVAKPPAPNVRSGMFGRPPGGATRMMIDQ